MCYTRYSLYKYVPIAPFLKAGYPVSWLHLFFHVCVWFVSGTEHVKDKHIARDEELSDSEDEGEGRRNENVHHEPKRPQVSEDGE